MHKPKGFIFSDEAFPHAAMAFSIIKDQKLLIEQYHCHDRKEHTNTCCIFHPLHGKLLSDTDTENAGT